MKRYLVFTCDAYYPCGGWDDFRGDAGSLAEAKKIAAANERDWEQIIDTKTMKEVDIPPAA